MLYFFFKPVLPESSSRKRANSRVWRHPKTKMHLSPWNIQGFPVELGSLTENHHSICVLKGSALLGNPLSTMSLHYIVSQALFLKGSQDSHNSHVEISRPIQKAGTTLVYPLWVYTLSKMVAISHMAVPTEV